ncbi:hypothetical protein CspeluHIS016_0115110 [Cutaneotrichosporon spelunceum]|uniref:Carboxylic ester hydrolase n=1 Tax=Cutaneotrichosporon spelunceum TaxID=1672016 RepID=A0AAD3TR86_9TREE|nr:hypothetical protein CspeluHIS016_0115110 [Cutaneotrichosporon spelunceum]
MRLLVLFILGCRADALVVTSTALATPVYPTPSVSNPPGSTPSSAASAAPSIPLEGGTSPGSNDTAPNTTGPISVNIRQDGANISITGTQESGMDKFFGIPYADPPAGPLRFARPRAKRYNGSVLATAPGPACLQPDEFDIGGLNGMTMDEDCLSLNIMAPSGNRSSLPVMVWIHGGAFYLGTGAATLSPTFVEYGARTGRPFVYVTLNYRLGVFGFGHGNVGLWDQRLALKWVKRNIKAFGGDPNKVTVFGDSAGAASIGFHMLDRRQDLFRGAIMQSGAPGLVAVRPARAMARIVCTLAGLAGCNSTGAGERNTPGNATLATRSGDASCTGEDTLECLRNLSAQAVLEASSRLGKLPEYAKQVVWAPTRDGKLVRGSPLSRLHHRKISKVPFICGTMWDEGTFLLLKNMQNTTSADNLATNSSGPGAAANSTGSATTNSTQPAPNITGSANISLMSASDFLAESWALPPDVLDKILQAYPDDPVLGAPFGSGNETFGLPSQYKQVAAIVTDGMWTSRSHAMLKANRKAWGYLFSAGPEDSATHPAYLGYTHGDDVSYIMGGVTTATHGPGDLNLAQSVLNYWINFAYYQNPNGKDKKGVGNAALSTFWETYGSGDGQIMVLSANGAQMVPDDARKKQVKVFSCPKVAEAMYW